MTDVDANLETILPEVHAIFAERAVEKDLSIIKRIKKITVDSQQIVLNREGEIKEVVRALQSNVEALEEQVDSECSLTEYERKIGEKENQKRQLLSQIDNTRAEQENSKVEIKKVKNNLALLLEKRQHAEQALAKDIPHEWDHEAPHGRKGVVIPDEHDPNPEPRPFEMDAAAGAFEACNRLWTLID